MEIGEFPGRRGDENGCRLYRPRRKGGEGRCRAMVGMLRGLRVDARCLATFPQHPSWTTAATATATAPIHRRHRRLPRSLLSSLLRVRHYSGSISHPEMSRFLDSSWFPCVRVCGCICLLLFPGESLESDRSNQNWKLEFVQSGESGNRYLTNFWYKAKEEKAS